MAIYHNNTIIPESTGIIRHVSQDTTEMRLALYGSEVIWRKGNEVTYIWNGNTVKQYYSYGSDVLHPTGFTPTIQNGAFLGWSTSPTATEPLTSLTMGTDPIILYAVWQMQYKVVYIWNGNRSEQYYSQGSNILNPSTFTPTKPDRQFLGWSSSPESTEILEPPMTMGTSDITLYAVWLYKYPDADLGYGSPTFQTSWNPGFEGRRVITVHHNFGFHIDSGEIVSYDGSIYEGLRFDARVWVTVHEGGSTVTYTLAGVTLDNLDDVGEGNTPYRKYLRRANWDSSGTGIADDSRFPGYGNAVVTVTIPTTQDFTGNNTLYWLFRGDTYNGEFELLSTITAIGRTIKEVG